MKTVIQAALMMYGIAAVIAMFVAVLIKGLYVALQQLQKRGRGK